MILNAAEINYVKNAADLDLESWGRRLGPVLTNNIYDVKFLERSQSLGPR